MGEEGPCPEPRGSWGGRGLAAPPLHLLPAFMRCWREGGCWEGSGQWAPDRRQWADRWGSGMPPPAEPAGGQLAFLAPSSQGLGQRWGGHSQLSPRAWRCWASEKPRPLMTGASTPHEGKGRPVLTLGAPLLPPCLGAAGVCPPSFLQPVQSEEPLMLARHRPCTRYPSKHFACVNSS